MNSTIKTSDRGDLGLGVHAGGRDDYANASAASRLHIEEAKLERRIESWCSPNNLRGFISVALRRRKLLRKLKVRFEVPYAMFVSEGRMQGNEGDYDPMNDYGLGRATTPTSIGGAMTKTILAQLEQLTKKQNKSEQATPRKPSD